MMCASSRITRCQETLNSAPTVPSRSPTLNSPHTTPYVVTTTSCARSVASSRRDRAAPWYTTERRFDFSSSSSFHCCMTIAGHTTSVRAGTFLGPTPPTPRRASPPLKRAAARCASRRSCRSFAAIASSSSLSPKARATPRLRSRSFAALRFALFASLHAAQTQPGRCGGAAAAAGGGSSDPRAPAPAPAGSLLRRSIVPPRSRPRSPIARLRRNTCAPGFASRSGGGADTITAIIDTVFPSPWSSARIPPRHLAFASFFIAHASARRWCFMSVTLRLPSGTSRSSVASASLRPSRMFATSSAFTSAAAAPSSPASPTGGACAPSTGGGSSASPPAAAALGAASARFARSASRRARQVWSRSDARQ